MSKTLVFRWHKKFKDGFTNHKDSSCPVLHKTNVTNVNIAAVVGLTKQDARLTFRILLKMLAYYRGLLIRFISAVKTWKGLYPVSPSLDERIVLFDNCHLFLYKMPKMVTNLKYQSYLQLMEPGYINLRLRDASEISSGCVKTKLDLPL